MSAPIIITGSIFAIFVLFNLYIRVKTFGMYKELVQQRIQFDFKDIFSKERWALVIKSYPESEILLKRFRSHMLSTGIIFLSVVVIVLLLLVYLISLKN